MKYIIAIFLNNKMPYTKEERSIYDKAYGQTPNGKKLGRIGNWKNQGIIVEDNDYNKFYNSFLLVTHCELCKKELTIDRQNTHSTRCVDHNHAINDRPNIRAICCNACNTNDNSRNTSGEPNIYYNKNRKSWCFTKIIQGKKYSKSGFKTKQAAVDYKYEFLANIIG